MEHVWGIPLTLLYTGLLLLVIRRWNYFNDPLISRKLFAVFFGYKVMLGMILTAIYTFYYTNQKEADIYKYYTDSYHMTRALWEQPSDFFKMLFGIGHNTPHFATQYYSKMDHWFRIFESQIYNDNHTIIRVNALTRVFSFGYFHIHTIFMAFLSFFGTTSFYKGFRLFLPNHKHKIFAFILFLWPSFNFWSSGNLKEALLIFVLGNVFYFVCSVVVFKKTNGFMVLLTAFSVFVGLYLKSYALAALLVGLIPLFIASLLQYKHTILVYFIFILLGVGSVMLIHSYLPEYNIPSIFAQKLMDFKRFSASMNAGSSYDLGTLDPTWSSLLQMSPKACFTGIFRPHILDGHNPFALLSALESLIILGALVGLLFWFERPSPAQFNLLLCCLLFTVVFATIIGLSTANFGSLVRYKIPLLPFLIYIFICLTNFDILHSRFGLKKNTSDTP